jgi:hypothetical protein
MHGKIGLANATESDNLGSNFRRGASFVQTRYKLIANNDVFLNYDFSNDLIYHMMTSIEVDSEIHEDGLTEQDIIIRWSRFSKEAFDVENPESNTPVDDSHNLHFGIIMLSLAKLSRHQSDYAEEWDRFYENLIDKEAWKAIYNGPSDSFDRQFYRCWFSVLGHRDFCQPKLGSIFVTASAFYEIALILAYEDVVKKIKAGKRV